MLNSDPGSQFQKVWTTALTKYKQDTERDYFESWLGEDSPDALFRLLDEELKGCKQYQKKRIRVKNAILPILELVIVSSRTIGESLVTVSTGHQPIFLIHIPKFGHDRHLRPRKRFLLPFGCC